MGDEQLQVLQMVAAGTITPEQGEDLLGALETSSPQSAPSPATPRPERHDWSGTQANRRTLVRLSEARLHGVTPEYIHGLADLGYADLPLEKYIQLRAHGVTSEYIHDMRAGGHGDLSLDDLMSLRVSGVNPEYLRDMINLGFGDSGSTQSPESQQTNNESEER